MPELYPEDQEKVDAFLNLPENAVEREDFKPLRLLLIVFVILGVLTAISYFVAASQGLV